MANTLTVRPIKIDTAMASGHIASGGTGPIYVSQIVWNGPVTAGDSITIIDPVSSIVLFTAKAATADLGRTLTFGFSPRKPWADYKLSAISSGTVYIHE